MTTIISVNPVLEELVVQLTASTCVLIYPPVTPWQLKFLKAHAVSTCNNLSTPGIFQASSLQFKVKTGTDHPPFIALKISGNSSYLLNGDWNFGPSRSQEAAGTKITYVKQDPNSLESIQALGPLTVPLDVMVILTLKKQVQQLKTQFLLQIVSFQANPGVKYRYSYPPEDEPQVIAPPLIKKPSPSETSRLDTRRLDSSPATTAPYNNQRDDPKPAVVYPGSKKAIRRRRNFHWKITGVTPCSKSCGGGEFLNISEKNDSNVTSL